MIFCSAVIILAAISCTTKNEALPEPMTNYLIISLSVNTTVFTDTTKGILWINNLSPKKFNYPANVSVQMFDTINKSLYSSNIQLNNDQYSTLNNAETISNISIDAFLSYNRSLDLNKLHWNEGIPSSELPASTYRLGLVLNVLEPANPGNLIQSEYTYLEKKE